MYNTSISEVEVKWEKKVTILVLQWRVFEDRLITRDAGNQPILGRHLSIKSIMQTDKNMKRSTIDKNIQQENIIQEETQYYE